jgi:hypothetical protein
MGEIQRIDVVSKTTEKGEKFNRVFVHFKRWFSKTLVSVGEDWVLTPHPGRAALATAIRGAASWINRRT